ncbi:Raffinose synthase family protein [Rhynchospora pubera]|uniref:galactinol--sucrose galactosyltransferase n=1 Tax=Rhynchospora pubera TaxID=906938 RepID=A0AAV8BHD7_9POAL|nr:Raffinose synthase family protein [Rhynchospora pubera]KAJ4768755.1 Raffinose synthase family protein [Rhynchospora pubera]
MTRLCCCANGTDTPVHHSAQSDFAIKGPDLTVSGHSLLHDVPDNVTITPASALVKSDKYERGAFLGFSMPDAKSRHVAPLGKLEGIRFMSIFRFKVWWTTLCVGNKGRDIENETQMMLFEPSDSGRPYVVVLPIVEGSFRASLQPGEQLDFVDVCVESGSTQVTSSSFNTIVYLHAGDDPYLLCREAVRVVQSHLGTFKTLDEKTPPGIVDKFGWCTWDAFYLKVKPDGVWEGVKTLSDGGCPPGLVLIDDGWNSICNDKDSITDQDGIDRAVVGEQMPCRLIRYQENYKFRDYKSKKDGTKTGMGAFVRDLKETFPAVNYVYVWHALCGYWGGVRPNVPGLPPAKLVKPRLSPGLEKTMEDQAVDQIINSGIGLVEPSRVHELYEGIHSHLKASGIDGVKVDVIHLMEMLCEDYGGRVELAKVYFKGLTESVKKYFNGNGVIASMQQCNDFFLLGTESICLGRVADDFWVMDREGDPFWLQGCHMVYCAYNSMWMGQFIHPDWDMFQSNHPCAAFHAASRAISGGPIYVSDSVGQHNFELLRTLVLPDGTILRCENFALPTRDLLFEDPLLDGKTMLKIWNLNKYVGVIGAFNCQGGGWSREARCNKPARELARPVTSRVRPSDIEWNKAKNPMPFEGVDQFAAYLSKSKKVTLVKPEEEVEITLDPLTYKLIVMSPVRHLGSGKLVNFAPIGLVNMLNSGGAVQSFESKENGEILVVKVGIKGVGEMWAYSSSRPSSCQVNGEEVNFVYEENVISVQVPWSGSSSKLCDVEIFY